MNSLVTDCSRQQQGSPPGSYKPGGLPNSAAYPPQLLHYPFPEPSSSLWCLSWQWPLFPGFGAVGEF